MRSALHRARLVVPAVFLALAAVVRPAPAAAATCEGLDTLSVPNGRVTRAESVMLGAFTAPAGRGGAGAATNPFASLPAFCRVAMTLTPAEHSDIKAEAWLPASGWNGKLQVVGNGNFAGTISYPAMATAVAAGYAAASTDTGHTGPSSNTFVHEAVVVDFAHRAIHETTVAAKRAVDGFYGQAPRFSYFAGCSTGGRQALTAAQRYPQDFDGIVAGAPASDTSRQAFGQIWIYQATAAPASALPRATLVLVHGAVLAACDGLDGTTDGVLENPRACTFDPGVLMCRQGLDPGACLAPAQVEAVRKIYAGASNSRTGAAIFPGFERGSELGWTPAPVSYAVDYFRYIVFKDPNWDPKTLDFDHDLAVIAQPANRIFDANETNLTPYTKRGGKLVLYQGWAEPGIPPGNVVTYFDKARAASLDGAASLRLFMVPGMGHCGGGDGTSTFDMVAALDAWVTTDAAPEQVPASRVRDGKTDRTRPLCAWPKTAAYIGSGSIDEAKNFVCGLKAAAPLLAAAAQRGGGPPRPAAPAPRHPDGRINFGPPAGETGVWERRNEHLVVNPKSYQAAATKTARVHIDLVPLQPWARALTNYRQSLDLASEPYTRCKPAGGPRQLMSPYGLEIVDLPDLQRVFVFNISNAQSYRTIYMDGRTHPVDLTPSYLGHSIGHWDGDTLVVDTVGFNEDFWMNRDGLPHTSQLHLTERFTRVNADALNYEVTIDDPGAYTAPWTSGYTLGWSKGAELFEYVCQENNLSPESMAGDSLTSGIAP